MGKELWERSFWKSAEEIEKEGFNFWRFVRKSEKSDSTAWKLNAEGTESAEFTEKIEEQERAKT